MIFATFDKNGVYDVQIIRDDQDERRHKRWLEEQNRLQPIREAYFALVSNQEDWKAPIDSTLPSDVCQACIRDAVIHFTGTEPEFEVSPNGQWMRVTAVGYRNGPCGP
jgi:hypothetical protein